MTFHANTFYICIYFLCFTFLLQFFLGLRCSSLTSDPKRGNLCLQCHSFLRQRACLCAEHVGNEVYVAAKRGNDFVNYCYHLVNRSWETLPSFAGLANRISSLCSVDDHLYAIHHSKTPYRYHISTNQWQYVANLRAPSNMPESSFCNKAALLVYKPRVYVLHGRGVRRRCWGSRRNGYLPLGSTGSKRVLL